MASQVEVEQIIKDGKPTGVVVADGEVTDVQGGEFVVAALLHRIGMVRVASHAERVWKFVKDRKRKPIIIGKL
jgi:hypothetical protein